jgi:hypothetical protein
MIIMFTMFNNYMDVVYFYYFSCDFQVFYPAGHLAEGSESSSRSSFPAWYLSEP